MKHEAWFFVGLFVFIFVIWIAIGGPMRSASIAVPELPDTTISGTTTAATGWAYFSLPRAPFEIGDSSISLTDSAGEGGSDRIALPPFDLVPGVIFAPTSPYRATVSMSTYVSGANSTDARNEYVELSVARTATRPVNITGWQLTSGTTGRTATVPVGVAVPTSGVVNPVTDILLGLGESAIIVSGKSPTGDSFRENKCIGYLGSFQTFTPALYQRCPSATRDLATLYGTSYLRDLSCIDYVESLSTCQVPTRVRSAGVTQTCRNLIETYINYNGCLSLHRYDTDFNGRVWRIYLGRDRDEPLWRTRHEVVELLDREGRTVDAFSY